ncbi:MAG TPA: hypothetical protein VGM72_09920 [Micropepsaceae bacterium]|jgi:hypothetical protein
MRKTSQAGFTLFEVMAASVASIAVIAPAIVFMLDAYDWYAEVQSELTLNREARQAFDLLGNGAKIASNGKDGFAYVYGIRGRNAAPAGAQRSNYVLQYTNNNVTISGDSFALMTVTCSATGRPLPDCPGAGPTARRSVAGWIGSDVSIENNARSIATGRTVEMMVTVTDPFQAQRAASSAPATETYRTVFTLNRDVPDP